MAGKRVVNKKRSQLRYIDLFAGCGGLSLGLYNAGWHGLFAIEKSPDAFSTLKRNLIKKRKHFDWPSWLPITNLEINEVVNNYHANLVKLRGQVDLVAGGPPCQGFSTAGRRKEDDLRNSLINSYITFIEYVQPKMIFFENVKGFTLAFKKNKDKGIEYASFVEKQLEKKDYFVKGELVNFGNYGVPQKRTRFILVGIHKKVIGASQELADSFFLKLSQQRDSFLTRKHLIAGTTLEDAISDLLKSNGEIVSPDSNRFYAGLYGEIQSPYQQYMRRWIRQTQTPNSHRFANHSQQVIKRFSEIILCHKEIVGSSNATTKNLHNYSQTKKHTVIPLDAGSKAPTITTLPDDYIHYSEPRILTVREYARLQSFPDSYEFCGKYTTGGKRRVLEVPRYSQIGNAIPPLFGEQSGLILKNLLGHE